MRLGSYAPGIVCKQRTHVKDEEMKQFLLLAVLVLTSGLTTGAGVVTNEEFARLVDRQADIYLKDAKALQEAEKLCSSLPNARRQADVRCVALQKALSKEIRKGEFRKSSGKVW